MEFRRRDVLTFCSGSALGLVFTPLPWKLLDDSAIWTQNWSWIPRPLRGEVSFQFTQCTLCPAGCAVKARMIGPNPVSLHPANGSALCPAGLIAHHLPYLDRAQGDAAAMITAVAGAVKAAKETVAILDERPGRAASAIYRRFLEQLPAGAYLRGPWREQATLDALAKLAGSATPLGLDIENARTILSFGVPVLDGWTASARVMKNRGRIKLIQADSRPSRTAMAADVWLPLKPGSELALALGIAGAIPRERASQLTGLSVDQIEETSRALIEGGPSIAIGGGDPASGPLGEEEETAIARLNLLGTPALTARREEAVADPKSIAAVPDRSIAVLIVDHTASGGYIPQSLVERKLAPGAMVVALSPFPVAGATHVVPAPAWLEGWQDSPACLDPVTRFGLARPVLRAPAGAMAPADFVARLAEACGMAALPSHEDELKRRAAEIHKTKRGTVTVYSDGRKASVSENRFGRGLLEAAERGRALDGRSRTGSSHRQIRSSRRDGGTAGARGGKRGSRPAGNGGLTLLASGWRGRAAAPRQSPLMAKLYEESELREDPGDRARVARDRGPLSA